MKLQLRSLVLNNFCCYANSVKIGFRSLPTGVHFVRGENKVQPLIGSNGSGKSTLFESICWALYGRTPSGLRNPDIRPWNSNGKTSVTALFKIDGKVYTVTRTTSPNSLMVNKEEVGQEKIDHDIMSFPVFTNTLLFGQGQPLFFDLTPQGKLDLFVDVLDLDRWDARSQLAAGEVKKLEDKQIELETELRVAEEAYHNMSTWLKEVREQHREWESENRGRLEELTVETAKLLARKEKLEKRGKECADKVRHSKELLREHTESFRQLEREYLKIKSLRIAAKKKLEDLEQQLLDLREAKVCPVCGQPVRRKELVAHREELTNKVSELKSLIGDGRFAELKQDIDVESDLVEGTREVLRVDEDNLVEAVADFQEVKADHAACEARLEEVKVGISPYEESLKTARSGVSENKQLREDLKEELTKLGRRLGRVKFWVKGFRACRLYLIEEVLDELRMVSNSICPELGLEDWEIGYQVERETKSGTIARGLIVTVRSPETDKPVRWESYSGGERQRLRLAGALALSETLLNHAGVEADFTILDEPSRSLSPQGVDDLCEVLPEYAVRLQRRIFYVDHTAVESANFASTLSVLRTSEGVEVRLG